MKKERIVSIKALIRRLLEKWRWLIIAGVIFAVAAAGYKAYGLRHLMQSGTAQETAAETASAAETDILSYDEMDLLDTEYDYRNEYVRESLLFRINPDAEGRASFLLTVEIPENEEAETAPAPAQGTEAAETAVQETETAGTEEEQTFGMSFYVPKRGFGKDGQIVYVGSQDKDEALLLKSYLSFIEEGVDWTEPAKEFSTKPQYLTELIMTEEYTGLSGARITVIYENEEGAAKIAEYLKQEVEAFSRGLGQEHILSITEERVGTVVDPDMEEWIVNQVYSINNLYTYKTTLDRSLGSGKSSGSGAGSVPTKTIVKILAKYAVFGFVLGVFLFAAFYIFILLVSGVVLSGREFNTQFGLRRLAVFPGKAKKNPIDRMIAGIDSSYLTSRDKKECLSAAVANTRVRLGGRGTVAVISDLPADMVDSVVTRLNAVSAGSAVYFVGADLGHSAAGIKTVFGADAAVILAQCGRSRYGDAEVLLETIQGTGKELLGSIVL